MKQVAQWGWSGVLALGLSLISSAASGAALTGVEAGGSHILILKSDRTVAAWGDNEFGQSGVGFGRVQLQRTQIPGNSNVAAIAAGYEHSLSVLTNGQVQAWGQNFFGQLGVGTNPPFTNGPMTVTGLTNALAVAGGSQHSLALTRTGSVWAWGGNMYGQLGNGTNANTNAPVLVTALSDVRAIAAGYNHSLALKSNGTVWVWGRNNSGQLGNGTNADTNVPIQVTGITNTIITLAAGAEHSVALASNGMVWTFGDNNYGQLGTIAGGLYQPIAIAGFTGITAIAAGSYHTLALRADGTVWAWGYNNYGQLGLDGYNDTNAPTQVSGLTNILAIAAGEFHSLALRQDGLLFVWGSSLYGEHGASSTGYRATPTAMTTLSNGAAIGAGHGFSLVAQSNGAGWAWGYNGDAQLGVGHTTNSHTPLAVTSLTTAARVSGGYNHGLALLTNASVYAWGGNAYGQLGVGHTNDRGFPTVIPAAAPASAIAAGMHFSLALRTDRSVWAWGRNDAGQLGSGSSNNTNAPGRVGVLSNISDIAAGAQHGLALYTNNGTVWAWGGNFNGQLGNGSSNFVSVTPVTVVNLSNVTDVAAGSNHSLAACSDGTVWAWGGNGSSQLGTNAATTGTNRPVQVAGISNVMAVAAGDGFSLALQTNGTVWGWGYNYYGQLGNGQTANMRTPTQATGLSNIVAIVAGHNHALALRNDGAIYAWGETEDGALGNGAWPFVASPQQVPLTGLILIDVTPSNGIWQITSSPTNYTGQTSGTGDLAVTIAPLGTYRVAYSALSGWATPYPQTNTVTDNALSLFNGAYQGTAISNVTGVSATDGTFSNRIGVTWNAASNAVNYEVWRHTVADTNSATRLVEQTAQAYIDTNVNRGVTYYYWVRGVNSAATGNFSSADSGYTTSTNAGLAGPADLAVTNLIFLPPGVAVGGHPFNLTFQLNNNGPSSLLPPNNELVFDFYLATNTVWSESGSKGWLGDCATNAIAVSNASTKIILPHAVLTNLTIPDLAAGTYYAYVRVRLASSSALIDLNAANNAVRRAGAVTVTGGADGGVVTYGPRVAVNDFDGDHMSDIAVYHEASGYWYILRSRDNNYYAQWFGAPGYAPVPADYDGDGETDIGVQNEDSGYWFILPSTVPGAYVSAAFGAPGYVPVEDDYDGNGLDDVAVYNEASGYWFTLPSLADSAYEAVGFGASGYAPVPGDYDGDGTTDTAVYHETSGYWYVLPSSTETYYAEWFGAPGYTAVEGDFDGDGLTDQAVYYAPTGDWYVLPSATGIYYNRSFGTAGFVPVPGDFDGDGQTDVAVYDETSGYWYIRQSSDATIRTQWFGASGYTAVW